MLKLTVINGVIYFFLSQEFLTNAVKAQFNDIRDKNFKDVKLMQIKIQDDSWPEKVEKFGVDISGINQKLSVNKTDALFLASGNKNNVVSIE